MSQRITDTHYEIERGWPISPAEYNALPAKIAEEGFRFRRKHLISDFILPTLTTNRLRIVRTWEEGQKEQVRFIRCVKNHPLKGSEMEDVRKERESVLTWRQARAYILTSVQFLRAPVPFYSKLRDEYVGTYRGTVTTIARDNAVGLGRRSGRYMEAEVTRSLRLRPEAVTEIDENLSGLDEVILGEQRKTKKSYRKMLMATVLLGEEVSNDRALGRLLDRYDEMLERMRDARSLSNAARLGERLKQAGNTALRSAR